MCGIIAGFNKKHDINEEVLLQFEDQSSRGTNGFGSIFLDENGKFSILRATGQIKGILDIKLNPSKAVIFHHRMPSASKNKISQTHPIKVSSGDLKNDYYFVHNGVIRNEEERKKHHEKELGYKYSTAVEETGWYNKPEIMFNDSEVIAYDIARFIEGQTNKIKTYGSVAFIMLQVNKKTQKTKKVFYGRNSGNPLKLAKSRDYIFLSSEGKGENIKEDMLYSFKLNDYKITKRKMILPTEDTEEKESPKKEKKKDDMEIESNISTPNISRRLEPWRGSHGYNDDNWTAWEDRDKIDDNWMAWEDEDKIDEYFDAAQLELDNLKESLKDGMHLDSLYTIDTEYIVKEIASNVSRAVELAREIKTNELMREDEKSPVEEETAVAATPVKKTAK